MKDQYFADKRDYCKWDFLEDLLEDCSQLKTFTNITMLTPPDDLNDGNFTAYEPGNRREELYRFLQDCLRDGNRTVPEMRTYFRGKRFEYYPYLDSIQTP